MADPATVKARLLTTFRDFRVDGVPASGANEPDKGEIRSALTPVVDYIADVAASVSNSVRGYALLADLPTLTGADLGQLAKVEQTGLVYRWDGDSWEPFDDPVIQAAVDALASASIASEAAETVTGLVKPEYTVEEQVTTDDNGFVLARFGAKSALIAGATLKSDSMIDGVSPVDRNGFRSVQVDEKGASISGMRVIPNADEPGVVFTDRNGFLLLRIDGSGADSGVAPPVEEVPDTMPYISGLLCGVQGEDTPIYLRNLRETRSDTAVVTGVIASTVIGNPYARVGADEIVVRTEKLGARAELSLRNSAVNARRVLPLVVRTAANPATFTSGFNVLPIGDSILNRQGGTLMKAFLQAWGYAPNFIGTMRGSSTQANNDDITGELGEVREGWETGDYTNTITDRSSPVAPGGEATYLAMSKGDQRDRNPFIRESTGGDDPSIVRNGYVLDFAFYQSRFSLPTPNVIIWECGTNDIRDRDAGVVYETVLANDLLILARMRAAWPNAKIIRVMPGAPRSTSRDALWSPEYIPVIRAMKDALRTLNDAKMLLCPAWAMMTQETGFALAAATPDPTTGALSADLADDIHPINSARAQLFHAVSAYVACAASNLI